MSLGSNRYSGGSLLAGLGLCLSCAGSRPPADTSVAAASSATPRRAPGIAEQRSEVVPEPTLVGNTRDQWLVLRAPAASSLARETVRDFLRATVNEALERMDPLLAPQATVDTGSGKQPARAFWQSRFTVLDYTELRGQLLFRETELEIFRAEDLARLPAGRKFPIELAADEIAVRVPIRVSWAGRARLFGDELLFRLQPAGTRYEIAEISEEFRLP
ncbi:MAG TPA: hypothetical protein VFK05_26405 [Polyangiaceae bacterium]|nr:hypothetical protein [Polyangiaceae bacterium]